LNTKQVGLRDVALGPEHLDLQARRRRRRAFPGSPVRRAWSSRPQVMHSPRSTQPCLGEGRFGRVQLPLQRRRLVLSGAELLRSGALLQNTDMGRPIERGPRLFRRARELGFFRGPRSLGPAPARNPWSRAQRSSPPAARSALHLGVRLFALSCVHRHPRLELVDLSHDAQRRHIDPVLVGVSARHRAFEHVPGASPLSSTPASSPAWPWPARRSP
jgi:hypothetical protein